jgi:hypothetical protein
MKMQPLFCCSGSRVLSGTRASSFVVGTGEWAPAFLSASPSSCSSGLPSLGDPAPGAPLLSWMRLTASSDGTVPELELESQDELEAAAQQLPHSFGLLEIVDNGFCASTLLQRRSPRHLRCPMLGAAAQRVLRRRRALPPGRPWLRLGRALPPQLLSRRRRRARPP